MSPDPNGPNVQDTESAGSVAPDPSPAPKSPSGAHSGPPRLTPRERRRRIWLLAILLLLLALLSYMTYYYIQNRRLPTVKIAAPQAALAPPQYLYSITGTGKNELERPVGVAVAADGRVYAVDFGKRRVSVFTNNGRYLFSFNDIGGKKLRNPVHLWIKGDEVWVSDRRLRELFVFDLEGKYKRTFKPKDETLRWTPLALAFARDGRLVVTDVGLTAKHRIQFFSAEGSRTATVGRTYQATSLEDAPGGFFFPNGVAFARDGRVYISDGDNRRLQIFSPKAEFKGFIDTSGIPRGIWIDEKQRLYVVDAVAHTVDVYDLKGKQLTQFGENGFGPGQFNYPNDITVRGNRIYVTDRDNNQVQVWGWPTAALPPVAAPKTPLGWLACLSPLLLLPLLFLLRKTRIVVTPDFVDALAAAGEVPAVAKRRRLRLIAPEEDQPLYEGREVDGVDLGALIDFEPHSESDARAIAEKLEVDERESVLLSMGQRAKALATEDRDLRRIAALAEVRAVSLDEFLEYFLRK